MMLVRHEVGYKVLHISLPLMFSALHQSMKFATQTGSETVVLASFTFSSS